MRLFERPVPAPAPKRQPAAQTHRPGRPGRADAARIAAHLAAQQRLSRDTDPVQRREAPPRRNETGLPDRLKAGVEALSGLSLDDVRVHYGSAKPARIEAHAYTQGTEIHVAPGQERHLAHEAWHVVQQKQGRVRPTLQLFGVELNDDSALEREAERFGALAAAAVAPGAAVQRKQAPMVVVQRATVTESGYTVSLADKFTLNHLRSSKLSALSRSQKRGLAKSTIINDKQANVKTVVEGSDFAEWKLFGNDPRYYQSFDLPHWVTTYADSKYTVTDEQTSAISLGAYFNSKNGKNTAEVSHLYG